MFVNYVLNITIFHWNISPPAGGRISSAMLTPWLSLAPSDSTHQDPTWYLISFEWVKLFEFKIAKQQIKKSCFKKVFLFQIKGHLCLNHSQSHSHMYYSPNRAYMGNKQNIYTLFCPSQKKVANPCSIKYSLLICGSQ